MLLQTDPSQGWTDEQRQYLPDGIRDSDAQRLLLEFKYTESLDEAVLRQVFVYDSLYRKKCEQEKATVQCFLVISISSTSGILARFGYQEAEHPGVYRSKHPVYDNIPVLLLNELADVPHNVFFKLFASRRQAKQAAVAGMQSWWWSSLPVAIQFFIQGLLKMWLKGVKLMDTLTPEEVIEQGKLATEWLLPLIDFEEIDAILQSDRIRSAD